MKSETLEARVPPDIKELVRQASSLKGLTMSEFMVAATVEEAHKVLERQHILRLEQPYFQQFLEMLDEPIGPEDLPPALVSAFNQYARNPVIPESDP